MKLKIFAIILILQTMATLSAQTRLHTVSAFDLAFSNTRNLIVNTIFDKEHILNPGFINNLYFISNYGFCVDEETRTIIYTTYELNQECDKIKKYDRKILKISEINAKCLTNLLHIVLATSSPQQEFFESRNNCCYYKYGSIIAELGINEEGIPSRDLLEICRVVCKACETDNESLIDSIRGKITGLTDIYKNLLNYDFNYYRSGNYMTIGNLSSYVYVIADFDKPIKQEDVHKYEMILDRIAHYLVKNCTGPVNCNIKVCSSITKSNYRLKDVEDIVIGIDDFTTEKMIYYCSELVLP